MPKEKVMPNTKVVISTWNNKELFSVWNTNDKGEKKGEFPIINMGIKKVNALLGYFDEMKEFSKDQASK